MVVAQNSTPIPVCFDIVPYNAIPGGSPGDPCYNACGSGASTCEDGDTFQNCQSQLATITCQQGTWTANPDGTFGCWGSSGHHSVNATCGVGSGACAGGGGES